MEMVLVVLCVSFCALSLFFIGIAYGRKYELSQAIDSLANEIQGLEEVMSKPEVPVPSLPSLSTLELDQKDKDRFDRIVKAPRISHDAIGGSCYETNAGDVVSQSDFVARQEKKD